MAARTIRISVLVTAGALVAALAIASGCSPKTGTAPTSPPESSVVGLSGTEAVAKARLAIPEANRDDWKLAYLSNTGVTQSIGAEGIDSIEQALMNADGVAGQWIVEFYKDEPTAVEEGDRKGVRYPFVAVSVTAKQSDPSEYEGGLGVPSKLAPLPEQDVTALGAAYKLAKDSVDVEYDFASASSDVRSDGTVTWRFRFYKRGADDIVAKVAVSGSGSKLVPWE